MRHRGHVIAAHGRRLSESRAKSPCADVATLNRASENWDEIRGRRGCLGALVTFVFSITYCSDSFMRSKSAGTRDFNWKYGVTILDTDVKNKHYNKFYNQKISFIK